MVYDHTEVDHFFWLNFYVLLLGLLRESM